jgi:hypothetical protein
VHNSISQGLRLLRFSGFRFLKLHKTPVLEVVYLLIYLPVVITGILEFLKYFLFRVIIISDSLSMAIKRIIFPIWRRGELNSPSHATDKFPYLRKNIFLRI